jgi:hypothetical protein
MFNFEKLLVWKKSISLAGSVYTLSQSFPVAERFGLTSQMRRAAVSLRRISRKAAPDPPNQTSGISWKSPPAQHLS